ncbi:MAG TPA: thiosulfate oxidation carrier protein SoxY [Azospirillum sp.]
MRKSELSRREVLGLGLAAGVGLTLLPRTADASVDSATKMLTDLIGSKQPQPGKVKIDMPQIAENGNAVPLTVTVESPMTAQSYVKAVHVIADGNPDAGVATFTFTPMSGKAEVATRMRLATTQKIWAVAEMSDGAVHMEKTEVKVTIGGCGG